MRVLPLAPRHRRGKGSQRKCRSLKTQHVGGEKRQCHFLWKEGIVSYPIRMRKYLVPEGPLLAEGRALGHLPAVGAQKLVSGLVLGIVVGVILRNAWVGDDAYISLRVADNLVSGYGLR